MFRDAPLVLRAQAVPLLAPHSSGGSATWLTNGYHMVTTWLPHGYHMVTTWLPRVVTLIFIYKLNAQCVIFMDL